MELQLNTGKVKKEAGDQLCPLQFLVFDSGGFYFRSILYCQISSAVFDAGLVGLCSCSCYSDSFEKHFDMRQPFTLLQCVFSWHFIAKGHSIFVVCVCWFSKKKSKADHSCVKGSHQFYNFTSVLDVSGTLCVNSTFWIKSLRDITFSVAFTLQQHIVQAEHTEKFTL